MKYIKMLSYSCNIFPVFTTFTMLVGCLLVPLLTSGCSRFSMQEVQTLLAAGKPEAAFAYMEEKGPKEDSIWGETRKFTKESGFLFERGLVAHYAKRFSESNRTFSLTEGIPEGPRSRGYAGARFERLLRRYYRVLNYIYLDQLDEALMECNRALSLMDTYKKEDENYAIFGGAGLLTHLAGMCFEAAGKWNNAFRCYQYAETYYQRATLKTEIEMPADVGESLVRLAQQLGFADEVAHYQKEYGKPDVETHRTGELVLFYESGYVPTKYEAKQTFPIFKSDLENEVFHKGNQSNESLAHSFVIDTLLPREGQSYSVASEYVLSVTTPAIRSNRPQLAGVVVQVGDVQQRGVLVGDVEVMAMMTVNAERSSILVGSLTNTFLQYLVYSVKKSEADREAARQRQINNERIKKIKEIEASELPPADKLKLLKEAEVLWNLEDKLDKAFAGRPAVKPASKPADTRSWKMLPNRIFFVRMPLPEGIHNVTLSFLDINGQNRGSQTLQDIEISPNQITFLNYRTYE